MIVTAHAHRLSENKETSRGEKRKEDAILMSWWMISNSDLTLYYLWIVPQSRTWTAAGLSTTSESDLNQMKLVRFSLSPIAMNRAVISMPSTVAEAIVPSFPENGIAKRWTRECFERVDQGLPAQGFTFFLPLFLSEYGTRDLNEKSDTAIPVPCSRDRDFTKCFPVHKRKPTRCEGLSMVDIITYNTS